MARASRTPMHTNLIADFDSSGACLLLRLDKVKGAPADRADSARNTGSDNLLGQRHLPAEMTEMCVLQVVEDPQPGSVHGRCVGEWVSL